MAASERFAAKEPLPWPRPAAVKAVIRRRPAPWARLEIGTNNP
ncbi:hypothetical protein [Streptomyces sp. NPDC059271]